MQISKKFEQGIEHHTYQRLDSDYKVNLFLGYNEDGKMSMVITEPGQIVKTKSSKMIDVQMSKREDGKIALTFDLLDNTYASMFTIFCKDMILVCEKAGKEMAISNAVVRWKYWLELFGKKKGMLLDKSEIKGLIGEFLLLKDKFIPEYGVTDAIASWMGPLLEHKDFEIADTWYEVNVRSFLSVKGKVNKNIQATIKNYPEMFFAYNNGIAATATELDTVMTSDGLKITRIKDLQIVNGGQTTASIANTLLTARKDENIDISRLFVPMKISVLEHSMSERIIPKISEYSNSQNKVDASDFFSNHPFHIRIEDYSRKTPAPAVNGNQYQQYWYYERTRGQYNQGKMKFKPKSSQMRQYETRYPESQVIKMVDLAKYMEIYQGAPDVVSRGKQAIVKVFAEDIKKKWAKSDTEFNVYYFKRVVALAIMFKATDNIIKQTAWYKEKHSYKANVIAYTMSVLFDYIRRNMPDHELDFTRIWNLQSVYPELTNQIRHLCTEVYEFITREDRKTENVTQWCKQTLCWERAQNYLWTIDEQFLKTLTSKEKSKATEKEAKEARKVDNEVDSLKYLMDQGKEYWQRVLEWGSTRRLLSDMELSVIKMVINMEITGRIPSVKQAKLVIKARERLIADGMPLQF